jgi:outer membrane lipoprotein-sorting protein
MRVALLLCCLVTPAVAADPAAILAQVDAAAAKAVDLNATLTLTTTPKGGTPTVRTLRMWQKGAAQRMVKLLTPPRLRGTGFLRRADGTVFVYLPSFDALRRVAGQDQGKPFMASVFTRGDMARTQLAAQFKGTLLAETPERWTLRLDPKAPDEATDHHLVIQVRRADLQVARVEAFEGPAGPARRVITATDFRVEKSQTLAYKIRAEDRHTGAVSVAELGELALNTGLADDLFNTRHLKRAP